MNWVMDRALPDDVPIEAKMVTKAIERAQTTVEQRNAEIRKNVLKYDEVMNEQRKVIYARRNQILEGESLRDESLEYLDEAIAGAIGTYCPAEYAEEWDAEGLAHEIRTYWPTELTADDIRAADDLVGLDERLSADGRAFYERREGELGENVLRQVERTVMLRVIDQRWREHLQDMDYLREGINLRAMGQKDPLTEWQREGFDMFGQMMENIARDFVKYVTHVEIVKKEEPAATQPKNVEYSAPESPTSGSVIGRGAPAAQPKANQAPAPAKPVVKTAEEKLGRNDPCHCGSGKKFKNCHGRH
jgi:preprotein translocase subunit SecA